MKNLLTVSALGSVAALTSLGTQAAVDVAPAVTEIGLVGTAMGTVGAAIIGLAAIALGISWVKATFF